MNRLTKIIAQVHNSDFFGRIFPTLNFLLKRELKDCETVLDLGCGPSSPIQFCQNVKYSVGVEIFEPYLKQSQRKKIHTKYLRKKIENLDFSPKSFDAVILIEVLEHLSPKKGLTVLKKAEKWAKKKVIATSPNGFIPQKAVDNNPYQRHLSGWDYKKMKRLGYNARGLAGWKFLRKEVQNETMGDDLLTSIRFRPKFFWFVIATFTQAITYYFPKLAFEIFSIKLIEK